MKKIKNELRKLKITLILLGIVLLTARLEKLFTLSKEIEIVSYNIHSGLSDNMIPTLFDVIDFLKNEEPDIICLQEVNESSKNGFQVSSFKENLKMNAHFGANVVHNNINYGLVTYTKFPIEMEDHIYLSSSREQRGFLHTVVNIGGKRVNIINVHLGLGEERETQLEEVSKFVDKLEGERFIIMGDFNESDISINNKNVIDSAKVMNKSNVITFPKGLERIDYVFVSSNMKVIKYDIQIKNMSDHYPIVVKIKL